MRLLLVLACLFFMDSAFAGQPVKIEFAASTPYNDKPVMLRAELYQPDGEGPYPAVILMHGCGGSQPPVRDAMRTHAEYLVGHGFVALVLDSFGARKNGVGVVCKTFDRLMAARRYRKDDALDALKYLQSLAIVDDTNVFQMGQSNGGNVAIRLAQLDAPGFSLERRLLSVVRHL
jgi:dienelactone hydrolase